MKVLAGLIVAAAGAAACSSAPPIPEPRSAPLSVATARVSLADFTSSVESGGIVRARTTALIASRIAAPITDVRVRAGDRVRRGMILVTLDARESGANRMQAEAASLASAEAARAAEADVEAADSSLVLARANHERTTALHAKRSATTQELDQAVAAMAAATAHAASARARLAAARAAGDAAKAAATGAEIGAGYAVLSAPFDGIVAERHADPGTMAMPGMPLLTIEDPAAFQLETQIDEARAGAIVPGQTADVRFDSPVIASGSWIAGRVKVVARIDGASHTFLVKIALPPGLPVRSGLFGRARFAGAARRAPAVPTAAVISRGQLTFVFVADAEGRARLRPVSIGTADGTRVEILSGVHERDLVVVDPPAALSDGSQIAGIKQ